MIMFHPEMPEMAVNELRETLLRWPSPDRNFCTVALREHAAQDLRMPLPGAMPEHATIRTATFKRTVFDNFSSGSRRQLILIEPDSELDWQAVRQWVESDPRATNYRYRLR